LRLTASVITANVVISPPKSSILAHTSPFKGRNAHARSVCIRVNERQPPVGLSNRARSNTASSSSSSCALSTTDARPTCEATSGVNELEKSPFLMSRPEGKRNEKIAENYGEERSISPTPPPSSRPRAPSSSPVGADPFNGIVRKGGEKGGEICLHPTDARAKRRNGAPAAAFLAVCGSPGLKSHSKDVARRRRLGRKRYRRVRDRGRGEIVTRS